MSYFISQDNSVNDYPNSDFMAFFNEKVNLGVWRQASGIESYYGFVAHENAKQCIVISSGRSESVIKYAELIHELYQNGYSVFIMDHQGQGLSTRKIVNPQIGYVNTFDDYVEDLKNLIEQVLNPLLKQEDQENLTKFLLCHSMGGAIGALFVQKYPLEFSKLILCAPMMGIVLPLPEWLTKGIAKVIINTRSLLKLPVTYLWGHADYQAPAFEDNNLTNCEIRYKVFREMMDTYPKNRLGGISFEWLVQAIDAMSLARARAKTILIPTIVFQAEQEQIVDNDKMTQFTNSLPCANLIVVSNAKHELLFEKDETRTLVLTNILDFLSGKNDSF